jgi:hypothetical protein
MEMTSTQRETDYIRETTLDFYYVKSKSFLIFSRGRKTSLNNEVCKFACSISNNAFYLCYVTNFLASLNAFSQTAQLLACIIHILVIIFLILFLFKKIAEDNQSSCKVPLRSPCILLDSVLSNIIHSHFFNHHPSAS